MTTETTGSWITVSCTVPDTPSELAVIVVLGNGFIMTSMIWATALAAMIDQRPRAAAGALLVGAAFAAFGVIHSVRPDGGLALPWALEGQALVLAAQFVAAYAVLALLLWLLSWQPRPADAPGS